MALRYTKVLIPLRMQPMSLLNLMMNMYEKSQYFLPIEHMTDCMHFHQLSCRVQSDPSDKSQRLATLTVQEDHSHGRIRYFLHTQTESMFMDGLTKHGVFPQLMRLLTTGKLFFDIPQQKYITIRRSPLPQPFTEKELISLTK